MKGWLTKTLHARTYTSTKGALGVAMHFDDAAQLWVCYALSAPASVKIDGGPAAVMDSVLGNHAHAVLGERKTVAGARNLCERYAEKWAAAQLELERCDCSEIQAVAS